MFSVLFVCSFLFCDVFISPTIWYITSIHSYELFFRSILDMSGFPQYNYSSSSSRVAANIINSHFLRWSHRTATKQPPQRDSSALVSWFCHILTRTTWMLTDYGGEGSLRAVVDLCRTIKTSNENKLLLSGKALKSAERCQRKIKMDQDYRRMFMCI